jgi:hypothetical protein
MPTLVAALALDIDMSLVPTNCAQETVPTAAANNDDVTVARSNLSPPIPVATEPNSVVLKLEFRDSIGATPIAV